MVGLDPLSRVQGTSSSCSNAQGDGLGQIIDRVDIATRFRPHIFTVLEHKVDASRCGVRGARTRTEVWLFRHPVAGEPHRGPCAECICKKAVVDVAASTQYLIHDVCRQTWQVSEHDDNSVTRGRLAGGPDNDRIDSGEFGIVEGLCTHVLRPCRDHRV